jgi:hypothetical protein
VGRSEFLLNEPHGRQSARTKGPRPAISKSRPKSLLLLDRIQRCRRRTRCRGCLAVRWQVLTDKRTSATQTALSRWGKTVAGSWRRSKQEASAVTARSMPASLPRGPYYAAVRRRLTTQYTPKPMARTGKPAPKTGPGAARGTAVVGGGPASADIPASVDIPRKRDSVVATMSSFICQLPFKVPSTFNPTAILRTVSRDSLMHARG